MLELLHILCWNKYIHYAGTGIYTMLEHVHVRILWWNRYIHYAERERETDKKTGKREKGQMSMFCI